MLDISSAGSSDDFVVIKDGSNNQKFVVKAMVLTLPTIGSKLVLVQQRPQQCLTFLLLGAVMIL